MEKVLITGGCGFIGHHVVEHILKNTDWNIVIIDKLNYASFGLERLRDIDCFDENRVIVHSTDFTKSITTGLLREIGPVDYILHLGAETHVDRSIANPEPFIMSNVIGTMHMLNYARRLKRLKRFVYFSTDEVFGSAPVGYDYKEWDRYNSGNPYAAAKAGGEELCLAYANTYNLPVLITHTMNVFGERQHPEKFIPICVNKILDGDTITIHSDKDREVSSTRHWIHARNVAAAILFLLEKGKQRDKYNIVGQEIDNLSIAKRIAKVLGLTMSYEMVSFNESRPGHDFRYALDGSKLLQMGFRYPKTFEDSFDKTIQWMVSNKKWLINN